MAYMRQVRGQLAEGAQPSDFLSRIEKGDLCAGCGACVAMAPEALSMAVSEAGYLRPLQSAAIAPEMNDHIAAICPGLGQHVEAGGRKDDPLWGPYEAMYQGHSTDEDVRFAGASGGGLTGLAIWLLESGKVQAIVQVRADPDRAVGNVATISRSPEEVLEAAGSRYAPAAPLSILPQIAPELARLAFIGKPCDAAALRAMAGADHELAARFPVILSFFCAGTPSLHGAEAVLGALGSSPQDAKAFRYRGNGWPGMATVTKASGETAEMSYHDSWGKILSKHVQHRCKICADGTGVAADIVCADAWEADEAGYPLFTESEGTSLVVARTAFGARVLAEAEASGALHLAPFDVASLAGIQPGQRNRRRALWARLAALRLLGRPVPSYRGLRIAAAAQQAGPKFLLRNFLGTLRRGVSK